MAGLIVRKPDGSLLLDTSRITYGLVKSAYLATSAAWPRKRLRALNVDPTKEGSYIDTDPDPVWEITVPDCIAPMCFLVGDGCLIGTAANGNTRTYYFCNASTSTRVYVFDKMREMGSGARLRVRNPSNGILTFNSYQVPLNIIAQVQAPGLGQPNGSAYRTTYAGGFNQTIRSNSPNIQYSKVTIPLGGEEYAAYLPYTRGGNLVPESSSNQDQYGVIEGVGGYNGGIQFMFGPAAGTTVGNLGGAVVGYSRIPTDRFPVALVTRTSNLPFPFN